ncbi:MAG: NlpC/P60 family protein [Bifidobacterium sp.]
MGSLSVLVNRMRYWCQTVSLGYSQADRWNIRDGGNADCSSLVIWCLREAGFDTGNATYTGNLSASLTVRGWRRLPADGHPRAGDILLNDRDHVAVYLGGGQLAQASISEHGTINGAGGDQTGRETNVRAYYSYPWDCYLRYGNAPAPAASATGLAADGSFGPASVTRLQQLLGTTVDGVISGQDAGSRKYHAALASIRYGSGGSNAIRALQARLHVTADGYFGPMSIKALQRSLGVTPDGSCGPVTVRAWQNTLNQGKTN